MLDRTVVAFPDDRTDQVYGYGIWKYLTLAREGNDIRTHIEIAYFGVHRDFQGQKTSAGHRCADVLYATVEQDARSHENATDDMPFTLECHIDNKRGERFWRRQGYRDLQIVELQEPGKKSRPYRRMVR